MSLTRKIAWKYLVGKKSINAIQIITGICVLGLAFGTAALLLIMSVFNGFEDLLLGMYNQYNPSLKIELKEGKTFYQDEIDVDKIKKIDGVEALSMTLETIGLLHYRNRQEAVTLKGIDNHFYDVTDIDSSIVLPDNFVEKSGINYGTFGVGLAYKLGVNMEDPFTPVDIYLYNVKAKGPFQKQFISGRLYPGGTFSIRQDEDYSTAFIPLKYLQKLSNKKVISALEIKTDNSVSSEKLKENITQVIGDKFRIRTSLEQEASTIKIMRIEKWLSFMILLLALILVALNLIGAIWMIVLDKKQNILVLKALGGSGSFIRNIFVSLGYYMSAIGFGLGIIFALIFYVIHKKYGIISMGEYALVDAYPMKLSWFDIPILGLAIFIIATAAIILPAWQAGKLSGVVKRN